MLTARSVWMCVCMSGANNKLDRDSQRHNIYTKNFRQFLRSLSGIFFTYFFMGQSIKRLTFCSYFYFQPWDDLSTTHGIQKMLIKSLLFLTEILFSIETLDNG